MLAKFDGLEFEEVTSSADGQRLLTASEDKTARLWNAGNGQLLAKVEGQSAVFSLDGQDIFTVCDKSARIGGGMTSAEDADRPRQVSTAQLVELEQRSIAGYVLGPHGLAADAQ